MRGSGEGASNRVVCSSNFIYRPASSINKRGTFCLRCVEQVPFGIRPVVFVPEGNYENIESIFLAGILFDQGIHK
jgi:hypothetical protein